MNRQTVEVTNRPDAAVISDLCTWGLEVHTPDGRISPEGSGFLLTPTREDRKSRKFSNAKLAVKALRRLKK